MANSQESLEQRVCRVLIANDQARKGAPFELEAAQAKAIVEMPEMQTLRHFLVEIIGDEDFDKLPRYWRYWALQLDMNHSNV